MTEPSAALPAGATAPSADAAAAGAMLRQAREAQGLQLEALAAAIKVTPAKLQALEAGRLGELPDLTFARALAQTVCRALKTDAAPVLAQMPGATPSRLERVDEGLNTPMPERGHGLASAFWAAGGDWAPWQRPVPWLAGLLLVAAAAFVLVPRRVADNASEAGAESMSDRGATAPAVAVPGAASGVPAPAGSAVVLPASAPVESAVAPAAVPLASSAAVQATSAVASTPSTTPASAGAAVATLTAADGLALRAVQDTWVQVSDANGRVLVSRLVTAGETLAFDAPAPLKLRIGNVRGTELVFRGRPVDLDPYRRDNVASLTLR